MLRVVVQSKSVFKVMSLSGSGEQAVTSLEGSLHWRKKYALGRFNIR